MPPIRARRQHVLKKYIWKKPKNLVGPFQRTIPNFLRAAKSKDIVHIKDLKGFRQRGHNISDFASKITYSKRPAVKTKSCKYGKLKVGQTYVCIKNPNHKKIVRQLPNTQPGARVLRPRRK